MFVYVHTYTQNDVDNLSVHNLSSAQIIDFYDDGEFFSQSIRVYIGVVLCVCVCVCVFGNIINSKVHSLDAYVHINRK